MNQTAERHLAKAGGYLAKGDDFYGRAADEIIAAKEADFTLSNQEIAERFGKSEKWVRLLVTWRTSSEPDPPIDWRRGSHGTTAEIEQGAQKLLASAPLEQVERIIADLPPKRQTEIATAIVGRPRPVLTSDDEDRIKADVGHAVGKLVAPFSRLTITAHLEEATEKLQEMLDNGALTEQAITQIDEALQAFTAALDMGRLLVSKEES
jgi:hypothetical protein